MIVTAHFLSLFYIYIYISTWSAYIFIASRWGFLMSLLNGTRLTKGNRIKWVDKGFWARVTVGVEKLTVPILYWKPSLGSPSLMTFIFIFCFSPFSVKTDTNENWNNNYWAIKKLSKGLLCWQSFLTRSLGTKIESYNFQSYFCYLFNFYILLVIFF